MNWERIYLVYEFYTSITVLLVLLTLGKFFCVKVLYDAYDKLNEYMDEELTPVIASYVFILIVALISLWAGSKFFILASVTVMVLALAVFILFGTAAVLNNIGHIVTKYHHYIKKKKNL